MKTLRIIFGILLIGAGLAIAYLSFNLFPRPVELGRAVFIFLPVLSIGIGTAVLGWGVMRGMSWRDVVDYISLLWR